MKTLNLISETKTFKYFIIFIMTCLLIVASSIFTITLFDLFKTSIHEDYVNSFLVFCLSTILAYLIVKD